MNEFDRHEKRLNEVLANINAKIACYRNNEADDALDPVIRAVQFLMERERKKCPHCDRPIESESVS
jgi:hypothetical protein